MMDGDAAFFIVDPETDENAATFDDATGPIANIKKTEKTRAAAMVYRRIIRNTPTIIISWSCWSSIVDVDDRRRRASTRLRFGQVANRTKIVRIDPKFNEL